MKNFTISSLPLSTVLYLHSDRDTYQLDPEYQRESDIWPLEKRQLLIDSIINGFDVPKIYFHKFPKTKEIDGRRCTHAIVDGKQRLSSIWAFIDGDFPLSNSIEYLRDSKAEIAGLTYGELGKRYPQIKTRFDSFPLSIVTIETDDIDLIEDMFSRLNEAVPLSAAEKRNAFGGPMPPIIRKVAKERFFAHNLPFGNKRYRHFDLAAKFLITEERNKVTDTKKIYLDDFVRRSRDSNTSNARHEGEKVTQVINLMSKRFIKNDPLLRSVGMVIIYYHLFRIAQADGWLGDITRQKLVKFEESRLKNREIAENDISKAKYDLLEFDRYVQTPNDAYAIAVRLNILLENVFGTELSDEYRV